MKMKRIFFLIIVVSVGTMLSVNMFGCSTCGCQGKTAVKKTEPAKPKVVFISKAEFQKMIKNQQDLVVIDVLSSKSFAKAHIKGAVSIPLDKLDKPVVIKGLDKNKTYVVYCASTKCYASTAAAELLMKHGFKKVYDYKAGLAEWEAAKLPVETAKLCKCGAVKGSPACCK
jgi:rhodanese-related sulfurtransferase